MRSPRRAGWREWRGLHNPKRHYLPGGRTDGAVCQCLPEGQWCWKDDLCRCCLAAEVERLTADYNAAVERIHELLAEKASRDQRVADLRRLFDTELADRDRKIDRALDIPIRVYAKGTVSSEEAAWHRGWNDAVTALHDAINPEFVDEDEGESDE